MTDPEDPCTQFWILAHQAIAEGLVTRAVAEQMAQLHTRKQRYWGDHLAKLQAYLAQKRSERACLQSRA